MLVPDLEPCRAGEPEVDALVESMRAREDFKAGRIPAGFTYLGQFIDHDITFDPTPFGARPRRPGRTVNRRTPRLDLDSLYGGGPQVQPYLYEKHRHRRLLLTEGPPLDLPRNHEFVALIGDPRNDENAIVSQLHLLFARFHNRIADELDLGFEKARRLLLRHYHWIVLNDYLPKVLGDSWTGPRKHFRPAGEPFIPVEFSGAAFRFAHSMVKPDYGIKRLPENRDDSGPTVDLFPGLEGFRKLETEREIVWDRFFASGDRAPQDSAAIDTRLAKPLYELPFDDEPMLARRTLLRGIKLGLPSGQTLAHALKRPALDDKDLLLGDIKKPMRETLARSTPLWYWILCEAQKKRGRHLGPLGALIVGEVLTGLIETDKTSFVNVEPGWKPGILGGKQDVFSMASLVRYARGEEPL